MVDFTKYLNRSTEAPTQRFRTFLQGVTFGFADEIEAGIRSIGSAEYDDLVTEVRGALKDRSCPNATFSHFFAGRYIWLCRRN